MNDDSLVKVMSTLGLNFNPAEQAIKSFETRIASLNRQLLEMKALALQGAKEINTAFSGQLGQLGGSKVILDQFGQPLKTVQSEAKKAAVTVGDMSTAYTKSSRAAKEHADRVQDVAKKYNILGNEFQRRTSWFLTGALFYGGINAAEEAVQTISEVEMGVTQIARVMEDSTFVFKDYRNELLQLGVDFGQSFEKVQDIALRWAQAGYNVKDSLDLTRTALLALNTAELDAKNATESMIGIMAQWQLTAQDLPLVLDKINKTADDFTVTSQDLIDGLLRSSGAAKLMGLSLEETISLLTVMREASGRTGQEVGNALNSILSYVQRPKSIETFEHMGIQVFADQARTQFRNVLDIFRDIAAKWDTVSSDIQQGFIQAADDAGLFSEELATALGLQEQLNDLQQRDISQAAAGVYRRNYFIGMIERLAQAQEVLNNMTNAAGYSMRENARTMDTLEKKYESFKTSVQQLAVALGDAGLLDILKGVASGVTNVASAFAKTSPELKAFVTTALEIIGISGALKSVLGLFTTKNLLLGAEALLPGWTKLLVIIPALVSGIALYVSNLSKASSGITELKRQQEDLTKSYNSQIEAADESSTKILGEAKAAETLANRLDELTKKEKLNVSEKAQLKSIVEQLSKTLPNLNLRIEEQTGKIIGNTKAIRDNIEALKAQAIAQGYQQKAAAAGTAYVNQEVLLGQTQNQLDIAKAELSELEKKYGAALNEINEVREKWQSGIIDAATAGRWIAQINKNYGTSGNIEQQIEERKKEIEKLQSLVIEQTELLNKYSAEIDEYTTKALEKAPVSSGSGSGSTTSLGNEELVILYKGDEVKYVKASEVDKYLKQGWSRTYTPKSGNGSGRSSDDNPDLQNALRILEHKKRLNQISIEDEIAYLKNIEQLYVRTAEERMDIAERIYDAEQALKDKQFRDSINWINEKKALDQLSTQEEIAAWEKVKRDHKNNIEAVKEAELNLHRLRKQLMDERLQASRDWINEKKALDQLSVEEEIAAWKRVLNNQKDNIEAVKEARLNLYKLQKQVLEETTSKEEASIEHWSRLGVYSIQQQIDMYRELYSLKKMSTEEQWKLEEKIFDLYKDSFKEQQDSIKKAYEERLKAIEDEAEAAKKKQQDIIDDIEEEERALERLLREHDYNEDIADLREQLAYWSVRTSEEARKKVAEINKEIAEKEHDHAIELARQALEDKKKAAQDEIDNIEETAKQEKEKWQKAYEELEENFNEHNLNIISMAGTMSREAYQQWVDNYIIPLQNALKMGDLLSFESGVGSLNDSIIDLNNKTANSVNAQVYRLADSILNLKRQYEYGGDKSAADRAKQYYNELEKLSLTVANNLHNMNYEQAKKYIESLPRAHTGAEVLTYGAAYLKPGELIFPPDLSTKLENLMSALYSRPIQQVQRTSVTDNRREIKIDKLLNIEKNYMEDQVDSEILSKELKRAVLSV